MRQRLSRFGLLLLCALAVASPAAAEVHDFYADEPGSAGGFEGPCGLAVGANGRFYVSDYYRDRVVGFGSSYEFLTSLSPVDPFNGPCGLAVSPGADLYVNVFHGGVFEFPLLTLPLNPKFPYGSPIAIDPGPATGVAVDADTGNVYVDRRTYVAVYEPSGAPLEVGGEPLRIGEGDLVDGYGVAVTSAGRVYVADAADDTVKAYDPEADPDTPVQTIPGPGAGFVSLRDAALAIDDSSNTLLVVDDCQPGYEIPEGAVYKFNPVGAYLGPLGDIVDARPAGLAVDNSATATQGRVYVTSGIAEGASVQVYESTSEGGGGGCQIPPAAPSAGSPEGFSAAGPFVSVAAGAVAPPAPPAVQAPSSTADAQPQRARRRQRAKHRRHPRTHRHQRRGGEESR